jgi:hypothetical protein
MLGYMAGTYLSFIDDVLLEAYLLDILVHEFGIWMDYILGHVVDELMKWSCCTSLISHSLISRLIHVLKHILAV